MNTIYALPRPKSYQEVLAFTGNKKRRKVAHNTYAYKTASRDVVAVVYHSTIVIKYTPEGVYISNGGWPTLTTADRFRHLTHFNVYIKKGRQYYDTRDGQKTSVAYMGYSFLPWPVEV